MVLYFSATGNTEYVAREIAKQLDDTCVNLLTRFKANDYSDVHSDKPFIICAPVYVCEMPRFMAKYLKKLKFLGNRDVYFVFTSGGYCGISGTHAKSIFRKKKMNFRGYAELKMPRNYVANTHYPMLEPDEIKERMLLIPDKIKSIVSSISKGEKLTQHRHVFLFEVLITVPFNPVWSKIKLRAKDFYTTDECSGCGVCEKRCPLNNINITDRKPVWGDACTHCMACIANCPKTAIEYGNITQGEDRYTFRKYSYFLNEISETND